MKHEGYLDPEPGFVFEDRRGSWSNGDAKRFLEWVLRRMDARTDAMLNFLGVPFQPGPTGMLTAVGPPLVQLLRQPAFRGERVMGAYSFTPHSEAVAFDLGLLVSRVMLRVIDPTFKLTVLRKPKSDIFFNRLVFAPLDNRWNGATWSPEYFSSRTCSGIMHEESDLTPLVEGVDAILKTMM